ncbi:MAG: type II toxin-antitoxin system RelE/ParE family toxin [Gallionellaceae bacterium]|jgi:proteic killer suppression protein|nr:type II toxin-antitoxin system RelE/ParE family toxin [Gallionellaceae bacterium]
MQIINIRHKGLRVFAETGNPGGLHGNLVDRLRNMLAYLVAISSVEELRIPPNFGVHPLKGACTGTWALTITRNWRMTFHVNAAFEIEDLDLEDYH